MKQPMNHCESTRIERVANISHVGTVHSYFLMSLMYAEAENFLRMTTQLPKIRACPTDIAPPAV